MEATGEVQKRRLPERLGELFESAINGLVNNSHDIVEALVTAARKGSVGSVRLLLHIAEQETAGPDEAEPFPFEETAWGKMADEPPYSGPAPSSEEMAEMGDGDSGSV